MFPIKRDRFEFQTAVVCLLATVVIVGLAAEGPAQDLAADREALVAFYNATDGPNWHNNQEWLSDKPLDDWYGVVVQNGRLNSLWLHDNNLTGAIPPELGNLINLQVLWLFDNQLTGAIPPELGNLANLQQLYLNGNQLTGAVPPELGSLANLQKLYFNNNQLTGVPPELGSLANLQNLNLSGNQLTAIPPELGDLTKLQELYLSGNQLTAIPPELGDLANLQDLWLSSNQLTSIPPELGNLANLQELWLHGNQLTSIPPELGDLANLQELYLSGNQLTAIPPELGNLANLESLDLSGNELTGIPSELGDLANLQELQLHRNQLTGAIPPELGNLVNLQDLWLSGNQLTGTIPPELGDLANLQKLYLSGNQLTGTVPPELGNLANLQILWLQRNQLTGIIPPELGNLANLESLHLSENQLTGTIPPELGDLANLQSMWFIANQLTGDIPSELGGLANLESLHLSHNQLMGDIPPELGNLVNLEDLDLSGNQLTGTIPSQLGNLANLQQLVLNYNQLTGTIPSELGNLANLASLFIADNQLTGTVPLSFANLVAMKYFWFHLNVGLCAEPDAVMQNWLDGLKRLLGPDCSPSVMLSVTPSNLVEGSGATPVMVAATRTPVKSRTSVSLFVGGTAKPGTDQDYELEGFPGPVQIIANALTIPAHSPSGTTTLNFFPRDDNLPEGEETIILQAVVGGMLPALRQAQVEGSAILTLSDQVACEPRDRAALEALYQATSGAGWTNRANWSSSMPLSEWHGVTVDNNGCVTSLDLSDNRLRGPLPFQLGNMVNLEELVLTGNRLTGIIPASFANLVALKSIRFDRNPGLCAQAEPSIRNWLSGMEDVRGPECSSIFVPVILTSGGRNDSFFTSELTLTNRGREEATLHYTYTAGAGGGHGTATDRLAAGLQRIEPEAIGYLTDLGIPIPSSGNRIGTLRVEVADASTVSVMTRTTAAVPEGRAGLSYPGIAENEGLHELVYLCGLRQNAQDRSNVALQNMGAPGGGPITLRTTVYSGETDDARPHALGHIVLMPGEFHQYNEVLKVLSSPAQGYVKVERVDGDAPYYAYGVINDNFNSDGSFVFPVAESSLVGRTGQTLPVIIETGSFQSELTVTNFAASDKQVDFSFVTGAVDTGDDTAEFSLKLKAGQQLVLPDVVEELRRREVPGIGRANRAYVGALFASVVKGDMSGIVVGARTGAPDRRGGQYSLFYNAVPYGSASVESAWIFGLQQNGENRSNLALVNTGEFDDTPSTFKITIYDGSGGSQPRTRSVTLGPRRWTQENGILGSLSQGYVQVRKTSGNNPFVAYGVINDGGKPGERSGDGAYVPARE